jgi:hypothetical protein
VQNLCSRSAQLSKAPFRSDIIGICRPDGAEMLFNGSTEMPHLTVLGHGQNKEVSLIIIFQLKFILCLGRNIWLCNRAGMV